MQHTTNNTNSENTAAFGSSVEERPSRPAARLSTARSRELGEELRRIRREANLSSGWVSEVLGWSLGKSSKLETGSRGTSVWEIGTLVGRCGADKATRDRILALVAEPDTGSFLRPHHTGPDDLTLTGDEDLVCKRRTRQGALALRRGPHATFYLHENVLRHLTRLALSEQESAKALAHWADAYERRLR
ncbi:helix-turn-helix domain-containing protein [Saccharothrix lopnurensis]|uniref:Helix-turn-helix domain-containing protein n=1 Tax=Saccharothrix lopnurensis TaxID=1670621 RepID=A0ABW1P813_9PSEU